MDLAAWADRAEQSEVPAGAGERFAGYGIMGLPFASGHVLAMRRFPASSVGPAYTSVWHRTPDGAWTFWQDLPSDAGCGRYFSSAVVEVVHAEIDLEWSDPDTLVVTLPAVGLRWRSTMRSTVTSTILGDFALPQKGVFALGRAFFS